MVSSRVCEYSYVHVVCCLEHQDFSAPDDCLFVWRKLSKDFPFGDKGKDYEVFQHLNFFFFWFLVFWFLLLFFFFMLLLLVLTESEELERWLKWLRALVTLA